MSMNLEQEGPAHTTRSADAGTHYVWYVVALLSFVNVFSYMDRMALAVLLPSIKTDMQLSDGQLGLLVGFAFSIFYAICGIPIARWADSGVRRNVIALALGTWSVMTALSGAAQNFWQLFVARIGVGAGEAGGLVPAQSLLCDYVPLRRRPGIFALHSFGAIVGMMLGMALVGWLGEAIGWRLALLVLGLPGVALALAVRLTLREPLRGRFDDPRLAKSHISFTRAMSLLWRCKTYRLLVAMSVLSGFVQYGLNQWWPSFYVRTFGLSVSTAGVYLGIALGGGAGLGILLGGFVANQTARRDDRLPLIIGAGASCLAFATALGSLFVPSARFSVLLVAITALLWSVAAAPVIAATYSVVAPTMRATSGAVGVLFASVLGFGLGPYCVGFLSDLLEPSLGPEALRYSLIVPVCLLPAKAVVLYLAAKELPNDLLAVGARS